MGVITDYGMHGTEYGLLLKERLWKGGGTRRGFIYSHVFGGSEWEFVQQDYPFREIPEMGYPTVSMSMGGISTWGNSTSVGKMGNAITQVNSLGSKTDKYILIGCSMGTLVTLNSISRGGIAASQVAAVMLFVPVLFLQRAHDTNRQGLAPYIESGYGGSPSTFAAAMPAYDPGQNTSAFAGIPIKIYCGTEDTIGFPSEAYEFAGKVGSNVIVENLIGRSHTTTIPAVDPDDIMSFVGPYL